MSALAALLAQEFPLLDDAGLDEAAHHCEWAIQQERKRLHALLTAHRDSNPQEEGLGSDRHESAQTMAHNGSAGGVSAQPVRWEIGAPVVATIGGLSAAFDSIESPGFNAGGGIALVHIKYGNYGRHTRLIANAPRLRDALQMCLKARTAEEVDAAVIESEQVLASIAGASQ